MKVRKNDVKNYSLGLVAKPIHEISLKFDDEYFYVLNLILFIVTNKFSILAKYLEEALKGAHEN